MAARTNIAAAPDGGHGKARESIMWAGLLALLTAAVFFPVLNNAFITYDDNDYITQNPMVLGGLTLPGLKWAFAKSHASNWHPLTWISHMLDVELFGLKPWGHHLTNLVLHLASVLLLFFVLIRFGLSRGKSAWIAALFAVHPLHVESVAWAAERKDVLSGFFFMAALWAYSRYVRKPGWRRYVPLFLFLALGLMAKQMLVSLPFLLLVLDFWPLQRARLEGGAPFLTRDWIPLWKEKIPLFLLSLAASGMALIAQSRGGAVGSAAVYALGKKLAGAVLAYIQYLVNTFWPFDLAVHYPYIRKLSSAAVLAGAAALLAVTIWIWIRRRRTPFLLTGWFWYIGTLVPVIGIVQIGVQSRADRYTYLPLIGVFLMLSFSADLFRGGAADGGKTVSKGREPRAEPAGRISVITPAAVLIVLVLGFLSWRQTRLWKDSRTLFTHALEVTSDNAVMHTNLALCDIEEKREAAALAHLEEAIRINPVLFEARLLLGDLLLRQGRIALAVSQYEKALRIRPASPEALNNFGTALVKSGRMKEAVALFQAALKHNPEYAEAHHNLAAAYGKQGRVDAAVFHDLEAVRIRPGYSEAHYNLAVSYYLRGELDKAFEEVARCRAAGGDIPRGFLEALEQKAKARRP